MGLSDALSRIAARHAHVLVAEVPGHWVTRAAVERHVLARGWRLALSPADADILAVCGPPAPHLAEPLHRLWEQLPGPRVRIDVESAQAVLAALVTAQEDLLDLTRQRTDSQDRSHGRTATGHAHHGHEPPHGSGAHADDGGQGHDDHGHTEHSDHDQRATGGQAGHGGAAYPGHEHMPSDGHGDMDTAGHAHADSEHAHHTSMGQPPHGAMTHEGHGGMGHGGMAHGNMDMAPGGIPLAAGGEDRDGLEMDLLHLRLGPVLAYWPAGLVLRCTLQGDVIVDAETSVVAATDPATDLGPRHAPEDLRRFAARRCDDAASLLGLAGWGDAASRARRIRDALLFTDDRDGPVGELQRLRRMVGRSWWLRWSLRRVGPLDAPDLARHGLPAAMAGDVRDRLLAMLDRAAHTIAGQQPISPSPGVPVDTIPDLVRGWDLATARLIVASLDLDPLVMDRETSHA